MLILDYGQNCTHDQDYVANKVTHPTHIECLLRVMSLAKLRC